MEEVMKLVRNFHFSMFYVIIVHRYFSKKKNPFLHIMSTTTTSPIELLERDRIRDGGGHAMSRHELSSNDIKEGR